MHFFKRANANLRGLVKRLGGSVRRGVLNGRQAASLQQLAVRLLPLFNGLAEGVPTKRKRKKRGEKSVCFFKKMSV